VHLVIDHSGHQDASGGVDNLHAIGRGDARRNLADALSLDKNVRVAKLSFIKKTRVGNQQLVQSGSFRRTALAGRLNNSL
jgi:hypothetical protein